MVHTNLIIALGYTEILNFQILKSDNRLLQWNGMEIGLDKALQLHEQEILSQDCSEVLKTTY